MFDSVEAINELDGMKHFTSLLLSVFVHGAAICTLMILPLIFANAIQKGELLTFLTAPIPPVPPNPNPPPKLAASANPESRMVASVGFDTPTRIPNGIPDAPVEEPELNYTSSLLQGVPTGNMGPGVSKTIAALIPLDPPKPLEPLTPIELKPREPIKMGGIILDARLIRKVIPVYPRMAQKARVSGPVDLEATIDEEGNVTNLRILNGHILLRDAAVEAVKQWKYKPLFLNGEPVPILAGITVVFRLN
jgi:periplasmic protein TonB